MDDSERLRETVRDWGDYRDHGDQGTCMYGERMDDSGRLGETAKD